MADEREQSSGESHPLPPLAAEIDADRDALAAEFPQGLTIHRLAGYYAEPPARVEAALAALADAGKALRLQRGAEKPATTKPPGASAASEPWMPASSWTPNSHSAPRPGRHPNKRARTMPETMADEIRHRLPDLAKEHPLGATQAQFQAFFAIESYAHVNAIVSVLETEEDVVCSYTHDAPRQKIVYARGMRQAPPPLTDLQEKVLAEIMRRANGAKTLTVNYLHVAKAAGVASGSVSQTCWALERKGYIRRITPYANCFEKDDAGRMNGAISPEYEILEPKTADPFPAAPKPLPKGIRPPRSLPPVIANKADVKRAYAKRAELVREIDRIDAFLALYEEVMK